MIVFLSSLKQKQQSEEGRNSFYLQTKPICQLTVVQVDTLLNFGNQSIKKIGHIFDDFILHYIPVFSFRKTSRISRFESIIQPSSAKHLFYKGLTNKKKSPNRKMRPQHDNLQYVILKCTYHIKSKKYINKPKIC